MAGARHEFRTVGTAISIAALGALSAVAATTVPTVHLNAGLIQTSGDPSASAGRFYGYRTETEGPGPDAFAKAKAKAEEKGVPLVLVWGNENCKHCNAFTTDLNNRMKAVQDWMTTEKAVFAYFKGNITDYLFFNITTSPYDAAGFLYKTCKCKEEWPMIGFYYVQPDGSVLTWGSPGDGKADAELKIPKSYTFAYLHDTFAAWTEKHRIGFYSGGQFTDVGSEFNRYEAEATTTNVLVKLVRDEVSAANVWTNDLVAVWPGETGETVTTRVDWVTGQVSADVAVRLRRTEKAFPVGEAISLVLRDVEHGGAPVATNFIYCVAPENAASNPKWIGEEFGFGEWTVDLDVATQKVAAAKGEAFTVISLQGSKWCPDCANVDRNFLDLTNAAGENAFCEWAKARQVALVTIDIPNFNGPNVSNYASPSLLDRTPFSSTLARPKEWPQSGADAALTNAMVRSGLGYLSRKSVDETTAAFYFSRNHDLASKNTDAGGFHRPEDGNANRTGVPIFVLLRKDGSVAARLMRMASVSPMAADRDNFSNYLKRFEEMMAIAAADGEHGDATEIENNYPDAGALPLLSNGGVTSNELCNADFQDTFRLVGANGGVRQEVTLSGASDAEVKVTYQMTNSSGKAVAVASKTVRISDGTAFACDFEKPGDYFVQVAGADITSSEFDLASPVASNFHGYAVTAWSVLVPKECAQTNAVPEGVGLVKMDVERNARYRITGIAGDIAGAFEREGETDYYQSFTNGTIELEVTAEREVVYQLWKPGAIAFSAREFVFTEYVGTGTVTVVRGGGSSGCAEVKVKYLRGTKSDGRFEWVDANIRWEDGESGPRHVSFPIVPDSPVTEPAISFTLGLETVAPVGSPHPPAVSEEESTVTILDNDKPCLEKTVYNLSANLDFETVLPFKVYNVSNAASVSVRCTSGSVPPGLSLVYDAEAEALRLSGVPRTGASYAFTVTLSERRGNQTVTGFSSMIEIAVNDRSSDNPFLARARPNETIPLFEELGPDTNVVAGTLRWALTSRNDISARYSDADGETVTFAGNWCGIDEAGVVSARLVTWDSELDLLMDRDGRTTLGLVRSGGRLPCSAASDWPTGESFTNWMGTYNVTFPNAMAVDSQGAARNPVAVAEPTGTGFISCRMVSRAAADKGVVIYAGALPDGTTVSGSGYLLRDRTSPGFAYLPIFRRSGDACLSAYLEIGENGAAKWTNNTFTAGRTVLDREIVTAAPGTKAMFLHGDYAWEYMTLQEVFGSYFVPGISPQTLVGHFYSGNPPFAMTFGENWAAAMRRYGKVEVTAGADHPIEIDERKLALQDHPGNIFFAYNPQTGIFAGSAKIEFECGKKAAGQFRGILIPGWTSCGCGLENPPVRPFGSGAFRFRDAEGPSLVTRSFPVDIDQIKLLLVQ